MLDPHIYLTRTKGKNSKIIPQPWTMNLAQSTILNVMKIPHFGSHREVNACVNILLSWFHRITRLRMQGPDPQDIYPGKAPDCTLAQIIKDTYGDVENGTQCYKVASIQNGIVRLAYQLITGKLARKQRPTQVIGFIVDLVRKCVEGL
jgi:hypothetical protein